MAIPSKATMLANARTLRKNMTPWERKLWYLFLRTYPVKIYKQRIIGPYIADFCCPRARLIVVLDGSQHSTPEGQESDARRCTAFESHGYTILRFPNIEIDRHFRTVCETIDREIKLRLEV